MKIAFPAACAVLFLYSVNTALPSEKEFLPTSAPIPMTPSETADSKIGFGCNVMNLQVEWKEDLLTSAVEDVGDFEYESRNLVFGIQKKMSANTAIEFDFLVGLLESKTAQDSYFSPGLGKTVQLITPNGKKPTGAGECGTGTRS